MHAEALAGEEVQVRRGLGVLDVVGGDDRIEGIGQAGGPEGGVNEIARRVRGERQRDAVPQPLDELHRAGTRIYLATQLGQHQDAHLVNERGAALGRLGEPLREVARREIEGGAHHRERVGGGVFGAVPPKELGLGPLPQDLGIEQQAVHVEDDRPIAMRQRLVHRPGAKNEPLCAASERTSGTTR
jgi:hypothetical protein